MRTSRGNSIGNPAGVRGQPTCFQTDNVGDVDAGDSLAPAGQVAGGENLEVMRGRVSCEREILFALPEDFVQGRRRQAVAAKAADGEIIAILHEPGYSVSDRGDLVGKSSRLLSEVGAGLVRRWVGEENAFALH